MVVAFRIDSTLGAALRLAARPDEDVVTDAVEAPVALREGFPRLVVRPDDHQRPREECRDGGGDLVPVVELDASGVGEWRETWLSEGLTLPWVSYLAGRLAPALAAHGRPGWVDRTLADLAGLAGRPLPRALGGLGRRVMEHPAAYGDLHGLESLSGLSAGALKARFRRRSLPSPFSYLRWFRALATAHVLLDPATTVLAAAQRLGWTSSGNLFRHLHTTTGFAPSELRAEGGERLLIRFAAEHVTPSALAGWDSLDRLFLRRTA